MKIHLILFFVLAFFTKANSQIKLETLIKIYKKSTLAEAKKSLFLIPKYQIIDTLKSDTILGKVNDVMIKAYLNHGKSNIELEFSNQKLYNYYFDQAKSVFKHTTRYKRATANHNTTTATVSFSNYDRAKLGSLEVILQTTSSNQLSKKIYFTLLLLPYYED